MNIYKIEQNDVTGYGTFDSAVVIAEDEETAKRIHPESTLGPFNTVFGENRDTWTDNPDKVKVTLLGTALDGMQAGVICASFE